MAKNTTEYQCTECSRKHVQFLGVCQCGAFGTIQEVQTTTTASKARSVGSKTNAEAISPTVKAAMPKDIKTAEVTYVPTGIGELDRVLGGGFIEGSVILLAGEPGAGKSTLSTHVADNYARTGKRVLLCSSEESRTQIKLRADRLGVDGENFYIASTQILEETLGHIDEVQPDLLIVDSVQTMASMHLDSRAGSPTQVVEVAGVLTRVAKNLGIPCILIGQVTKEGNIAGPKTFEHLVDVVLHFEGDEDSPLRMLRGIKNRHGAADEIGCFEHTEHGLQEVTDPSGLLLGRREKPSEGVATSIITQGRRCLPVEIQALVSPTRLPVPRRTVANIDSARSIMTQAVTEKHGRIYMGETDVFVATVGGFVAKEPAVDLAVSLALTTSRKRFALPIDMVVIGELTLSGDVRAVQGLPRRLREAQRLGFTQAIVPFSEEPIRVKGVTCYPVKTMKEAIAVAQKYGISTEELEENGD